MLSSLQMEDEGESSDRGSKGVTISISVNPSLSLPTRDKPVRFLCIVASLYPKTRSTIYVVVTDVYWVIPY